VKLVVVNLLQFSRLIIGRLRVFLVAILAVVLLSGCVQYDLGVNWEGAHRGKFVQHIKLEERLTNFSNSQVQDWLQSIERRAKQLDGKTKRISNQEIVVTIPFSNAKELESKFNQFFNPVEQKSDSQEALNLPKFDSKVHLNQGNFIFWERGRLSYDLDLRSLGVLSDNGSVIVSPSSLLNLQFSLVTPWGARSIEKDANSIVAEVDDQGHKLVWTLQPGQINHLEAVFLLPNPLGVGTLLIVLFVLAGFYVKYKSFPWQTNQTLTPATLSKL
jgi:Protein of unknown function (DUF3153)